MTTTQAETLEVVKDGIDEVDILSLVDEPEGGGHMIRNLVLLIVAATVVGAVVMALRGRSA